MVATTTTDASGRPDHRAAAEDPADPRGHPGRGRAGALRRLQRRALLRPAQQRLARSQPSKGVTDGNLFRLTLTRSLAELEGTRCRSSSRPTPPPPACSRSALPAGSQVVARPDDVDGWLNGRGDSAVVHRSHRGHGDGRGRRRPGPSRRTPPPPSCCIRHELEPEVFAQAMQAGIGAVVAADDHGGARQRDHPGAGAPGRRSTVRPAYGRRPQRPGVHRLLPQGRRRQDHDGGQPRPRPGRAPAREVCVVDLDLAFGDVAITHAADPGAHHHRGRGRPRTTWTSRCSRSCSPATRAASRSSRRRRTPRAAT